MRFRDVSKRLFSSALALTLAFGFNIGSAGTALSAAETGSSAADKFNSDEYAREYLGMPAGDYLSGSIAELKGGGGGVLGFGEDFDSNPNEMINVTVTFKVPPSELIRLNNEVNGGMGIQTFSDESPEDTALAAHDDFWSEMSGINGGSRSRSAGYQTISEHHLLFNGVYMTVPAGMVSRIAELPSVYCVSPTALYFADDSVPSDSVSPLMVEALTALSETEEETEETEEPEEELVEEEPVIEDTDETEAGESAVPETDEPLLMYSNSGDLASNDAYPRGINDIPTGGVSEDYMKETIDMYDLNRIHEELGVTGKGVKVAVLDTGIDFTHPAFDGIYMDGENCMPAEWEEQTKRDALGEWADTPMETTYKQAEAYGSETIVLQGETREFVSYHGTHVSGTIAAIAPDAELYVYRVLGAGGMGYGNSTMVGIEKAYELGVDVMNLSLGVNMNMPYDEQASALNICVLSGIVVCLSAGNNNLGNEGKPESLGTPGVASLPITVAAGRKGGYRYTLGSYETVVTPKDPDGSDLGSRNVGAELFGYSIPQEYDNESGIVFDRLIEDKGLVNLSGAPGNYKFEYVFVGTGGDNTGEPLDAVAALGSLEGKIAVVQRSALTTNLFAQFAYDLGAAAVIILNHGDAGDDEIIPPSWEGVAGYGDGNIVPALMVSSGSTGTGGFFESEVTSPVGSTGWAGSFDNSKDLGKTGTIEFAAFNPKLLDAWPDDLANFSSQGPVSQTYQIKPDITAPGWLVMSTFPAFYTNPDHNDDDNWEYAFKAISGTSMSSPHMAGFSALMVERFGKDKATEIKARLMNTATALEDPYYSQRNGEEYDYSVNTAGAGNVDPLSALQSEHYATVEHDIPWLNGSKFGDNGYSGGGAMMERHTMASLSFGAVEEGVNDTMTIKVEGSDPDGWASSVVFNNDTEYGADNSDGALEITVTGEGDGEYLVDATFDADIAENDILYEGYITLSKGGEDIRMPFSAANDITPMQVSVAPAFYVDRPVATSLKYDDNKDIVYSADSNLLVIESGIESNKSGVSNFHIFLAPADLTEYESYDQLYSYGFYTIPVNQLVPLPIDVTDFMEGPVPEGVYQVVLAAGEVGEDPEDLQKMGEYVVVSNTRPEMEMPSVVPMLPGAQSVTIRGNLKSSALEEAKKYNIRGLEFIVIQPAEVALTLGHSTILLNGEDAVPTPVKLMADGSFTATISADQLIDLSNGLKGVTFQSIDAYWIGVVYSALRVDLPTGTLKSELYEVAIGDEGLVSAEASPADLPGTGGESEITFKGMLVPRKVGVFLGDQLITDAWAVDKTTSGDAAEQKVKLQFPASDGVLTYTVKLSDGRPNGWYDIGADVTVGEYAWVVFDGNGGVPTADSIKVEDGSPVGSQLPIANRRNYYFRGWNTARDGSGEDFTGATPVSGKMTVYAMWANAPTNEPPEYDPPSRPANNTSSTKPSGTASTPAPAAAPPGYSNRRISRR